MVCKWELEPKQTAGGVGGLMGTLFLGEWAHFNVKMTGDGKQHKILIYSSIDSGCNNDKWFANGN